MNPLFREHMLMPHQIHNSLVKKLVPVLFFRISKPTSPCKSGDFFPNKAMINFYHHPRYNFSNQSQKPRGSILKHFQYIWSHFRAAQTRNRIGIKINTFQQRANGLRFSSAIKEYLTTLFTTPQADRICRKNVRYLNTTTTKCF